MQNGGNPIRIFYALRPQANVHPAHWGEDGTLNDGSYREYVVVAADNLCDQHWEEQGKEGVFE